MADKNRLRSVEPTSSVPPPEETASLSVTAFKADRELIYDVYAPGERTRMMRRLIRRFCDDLRKAKGLPVRGMPQERRRRNPDI